MSIETDGELIVMRGIWGLLMKVAIAMAIPVFSLGMAWAIWVTTSTFDHSQRLAVMDQRLQDIKTTSLGIRSQIGKLPGQLAAKVKPGSNDNPDNN